MRVTVGNFGLCCYGCMMSFIKKRKANESIKVLFENGGGGGLFLICKHYGDVHLINSLVC